MVKNIVIVMFLLFQSYILCGIIVAKVFFSAGGGFIGEALFVNVNKILRMYLYCS